MDPSGSSGSTQRIPTQEFQEMMARRHNTSTQPSNLKPPTVTDHGTTSPDFLKIVPCNKKAKVAFDALYAKKGSPDLSEHHAQFLVGTGVGPLEKTQPLQNISSDEVSDSHQEDDDSRIINLGHFRVNFDCLTERDPQVRWTIGRGSNRSKEARRNVDILLATNKFGRLQYILEVHAFLQFHFESGVWMILAAAGSDEIATSKGVTTAAEPVATVFIDNKEIFGEQSWCLTKPQTRLQIQNLEYLIEFTVTGPDEIQAYRKARDAVLQNQGIEPPRTRITGIPLPNDITVKGLAVFSKGLASGTFGCVYEGVEPVSGDLRAVKVMELKTEDAGEVLKPELTICDELGDRHGLVRQYGWQNSNGEAELEVDHYPVTIYLVMEMGLPFHKQDWKEPGWATIDTRLRLCRDLLTGLAAIHAKGWMHRDVTQQNILVFKARPGRPQRPRAALCDFGKLCTRSEATWTALAAWAYLPPEIVRDAHPLRTYNQSIDVWMLALALVHAWYPQAKEKAVRWPHQQLRTPGVEAIRSQLSLHPDSGLRTLLRSMLSVTPSDRPTASEALEDPCFRNLDVESQKVARISDKDDNEDDDDDGAFWPPHTHTHESQEL